MKELASYLPSPYVNEYRTFDGEIEIDKPDEGDKEKYFVNITNYFKIQSQLFESLNKNFILFAIKSNSNRLGPIFLLGKGGIK